MVPATADGGSVVVRLRDAADDAALSRARRAVAGAVERLARLMADVKLAQEAVEEEKRAEQQEEEETVAPPSPPPRTVSTSSEAGSGRRGRPPGGRDKNYEARKEKGKPSVNDQKYNLEQANEALDLF